LRVEFLDLGENEKCGKHGALLVIFRVIGRGEMDAKTVMVADAKRPAEPTSPDNDKSKQPRLSDSPLGSSGDDSLFGLADYISSMVVQFLGVRSLVSFGATGKSQRKTMQNEVERRKAYIADVEVEVTGLMATSKQSAKLSNYINKYIKVHSDSEVYDTRYEELLDDLIELSGRYKCLAEKNGEVTVGSLTHDNFVAAKKLVYDAMRLIDDEIGIFHNRLVTTDDGTEYYDIWEDIKLPKGPSCFNEYEEIGPWSTGSPSIVVNGQTEVIPLPKRSDHDIALPFGKIEPGDKIRLFRRERKKFYSRARMTVAGKKRSTVGPLFILPRCFYFSPRDEMSRMSRGAIKKACRWACWVDVHKYLPIDEAFDSLIEKKAIEIAEDGNVDAFRIAARELFFKRAPFMRDYLMNIIKVADDKFDEGNGFIDDGSVYSSEDEDFESDY
jgi:hypothetical protein